MVTAITVGEDGTRRIVSLTHADTEGLASWKGFMCGLRERSLSGRQHVTFNAHRGIVRTVMEIFPGITWQRFAIHLERCVIDAHAKRTAAGPVLRATFDEDNSHKARTH